MRRWSRTKFEIELDQLHRKKVHVLAVSEHPLLLLYVKNSRLGVKYNALSSTPDQAVA